MSNTCIKSEDLEIRTYLADSIAFIRHRILREKIPGLEYVGATKYCVCYDCRKTRDLDKAPMVFYMSVDGRSPTIDDTYHTEYGSITKEGIFDIKISNKYKNINIRHIDSNDTSHTYSVYQWVSLMCNLKAKSLDLHYPDKNLVYALIEGGWVPMHIRYRIPVQAVLDNIKAELHQTIVTPKFKKIQLGMRALGMISGDHDTVHYAISTYSDDTMEIHGFIDVCGEIDVLYRGAFKIPSDMNYMQITSDDVIAIVRQLVANELIKVDDHGRVYGVYNAIGTYIEHIVRNEDNIADKIYLVNILKEPVVILDSPNEFQLVGVDFEPRDSNHKSSCTLVPNPVSGIVTRLIIDDISLPICIIEPTHPDARYFTELRHALLTNASVIDTINDNSKQFVDTENITPQ